MNPVNPKGFRIRPAGLSLRDRGARVGGLGVQRTLVGVGEYLKP